jgi:tRNA U34 5-methylaminomethyl-2-thiouridine-forming methyltransferase MnmC
MWSEIADDPVVENSETGDGTVEECCVVLDENQMDTNQIDKYSEVNPVSLHYFAIKLCHFHQNDKNCQTEQVMCDTDIQINVHTLGIQVKPITRDIGI